MERAEKVVIHLFSGKTKAHEFGHLPSSIYVLSIDLDQGADILSDGLRQYLVGLCASGKVVAIIGVPPCSTLTRLREPGEHDGGPKGFRDRSRLGRFGTLLRDLTKGERNMTNDHTVMHFRMFLLHHIAHEGSEEGVLFVLENPMDPAEYFSDNISHASIWAWPELRHLEEEKRMFRVSFSQRCLGHQMTKPTTLLVNDWGLYSELHGRMIEPVAMLQLRRQATLQERVQQSKGLAKWAPGLTQAIGRTVVKWTTTPALERQRIMRMEQACVRTLSKNDRAFIEHCERDHLGFRRP